MAVRPANFDNGQLAALRAGPSALAIEDIVFAILAGLPNPTASWQHAHIVNLAFSGDGSTVVFELPAAPVDEFSAAAYVAGVRVPVTLSGGILTTMTFDSAPASGTDNITVDIVAVLV